jgi:hypothetical protein
VSRAEKLLCILGLVLLVVVALILLAQSWVACAGGQQYLTLDTTYEQFLGQDPGALGSVSALTFTVVSRIGDGEVQLLPLGVVGDWETLPSPLLPRPVESAGAVLYVEPDPPYRRRIYLIGGYDFQNMTRLDTVYTCDVNPDGSLTDWITQTAFLPVELSSPAAAISTEDFHGDPITPTIYLVGGYSGGALNSIYYAYIDPVTLNIGPWRTSPISLPEGRLGLSAVADRGYLYAIGGYNYVGDNYSAAVWHFPLEANGQPGSVAVDYSLPGSSTNNPNAAYHQTVLLPGVSPSFPTDTLYVIGGYNGDNSTARVLRGDLIPAGMPETGYVQSWVDISADDLPQPLSAFGVAVGNPQDAGRQVYVIGGDQGVNGGDPQDTIRSAAVDDEHNTFYEWYGGSWFTSPALPAARYRHAVVQVGEYIYAIGGHGEGPSTCYRDVLRGNLIGAGARQYAPNGVFRSRVVDLGSKYRLTWLEWSSTLTPTDPGVSLTLQVRAGNQPDLSDAGESWSPLFATDRGQQATTLVPFPNLANYGYYPPIARYIQYRAFFSTTAAFSDISPLLHEVGLQVEVAPDLVVSNIQKSCRDCYAGIGIISQTIQVSVTVRNQSGNVPPGNNFFTVLFVTTTAGFSPHPPDWPTDGRFLPGSTYWSMNGVNFPSGASRSVATTLFFTQPCVVHLYAYADYNDTSPPPDYDVGEPDPANNMRVLYLLVIDPSSPVHTVYLPLILQEHSLGSSGPRGER